MTQTVTLNASARDRAGKGAARSIRREGRVPAVIYGDKQDPQLITLEYRDLMKQVLTGRFLSTLVDIEVNGSKVRTIPRDIQFDPVRDFIIHADFLRLGKDARVTVEVQVHFLNEDDSPGLVRGGALNVVRYAIEVSCPAESIPEFFELDVTGMDIGDSLHASDLALPEGVEFTITDRDFTIATIAAPSGGETEEEEEGEAAEGEAEGEEEAAEEGEASEEEGASSDE